MLSIRLCCSNSYIFLFVSFLSPISSSFSSPRTLDEMIVFSTLPPSLSLQSSSRRLPPYCSFSCSLLLLFNVLLLVGSREPSSQLLLVCEPFSQQSLTIHRNQPYSSSHSSTSTSMSLSVPLCYRYTNVHYDLHLFSLCFSADPW